MTIMNAIKFSDRIRYQKLFEEWCSSISGYSDKVIPVFASAIIWMQATKDGRKLVRELLAWIEETEGKIEQG